MEGAVLARARPWPGRSHPRVVSSSPLKAHHAGRVDARIVAFTVIGQKIVSAQRNKEKRRRRRRQTWPELMLKGAHCS